MFTQSNRWTHLLFLVTLSVTLCVTGTLTAGKGGKKKPPPPPAPDFSFSMTLLGTLGGDDSEAVAINQLGDVLGLSQTADDVWAPFVYFNDTNQMFDLRDLLTDAELDRWRWADFDGFDPSGINSTGQICGGAIKQDELGNSQGYHAIRISLVFDNEGVVLGAGTVTIVGPVDSFASRALGINEFGEVAGWYCPTPDGDRRGFARLIDLGSIDIGGLGGQLTYGEAINNSGHVAGWSENAEGERRAFRFTTEGGMQDLGIIKKGSPTHAFGNDSYGNEINDSGIVVGQSTAGTSKGATVSHAFSEAGNGMDDLKTLDGDAHSAATSINSSGEIVGWSRDLSGYNWRGFLYTNEHGMLELNSLIDNLPPDTGNIYVGGIRNNDAGEICGSFWFTDGTTEAFLLTPNP